MIGTKVSPHYQYNVAGGATEVLRLRLTSTGPDRMTQPFSGFDVVFQKRIEETDAFYDSITPATLKRQDPARVILMRQALAGMLWTNNIFTMMLINGWKNTTLMPGRGVKIVN